MSNSVSQLNSIRKRLNEAVGEDFKIYLNIMKLWFRQKKSKEDFDCEARQFFNSENVHLHNEFLLAILNKCQTLSSSTNHKPSGVATVQPSTGKEPKLKKGKIKKKIRPVRATFEHRFSPITPLTYTPPVVTPPLIEEHRVQFCVREFLVPDISMIHGRMFVTAWEMGLDEVDDSSVKVLFMAVQVQLKRLVRAMCARRTNYKLRDKRFQYLFGAESVNPYIKNSYKIIGHQNDNSATNVSESGDHVPSMRPTWDWAESEAAAEMACSGGGGGDVIINPPLRPLTSVAELLEALRVHPGVLPSHSVSAINVERAICKLYHPSLEEIDQESIHAQEECIKGELGRQIYSKNY